MEKARERRIVISGVGFLSPAGSEWNGFWSSLTSGCSVLSPYFAEGIPDFPIRLAGRIDSADLKPEELSILARGEERAQSLGLLAARRALRDAGFGEGTGQRPRIGIVVGTGAGPTQTTESAYLSYATGGWKALRPRTVPNMMFNTLSAQIAIRFGLSGPQLTVAAACASSNLAISRAFDLIKSGKEDVILCGGIESPLLPSVLGAWAALRVTSLSEDPQRAILPFHRSRTGICISEGTALFVLEDLEHALSRRSRIYAELAGYGENCDAFHITKPDSRRQAEAMILAIQDAGWNPSQVDYINAHGTATELNDVTENNAIKAAFGEHAHRVPISSSKSVFGHALGASGALELLAVLAAFRHQTLPPTANLTDPDPRCDLDYVPCQPRAAKVLRAISNSFAFGGANSVLAIQSFPGGNEP